MLQLLSNTRDLKDVARTNRKDLYATILRLEVDENDSIYTKKLRGGSSTQFQNLILLVYVESQILYTETKTSPVRNSPSIICWIKIFGLDGKWW